MKACKDQLWNLFLEFQSKSKDQPWNHFELWKSCQSWALKFMWDFSITSGLKSLDVPWHPWQLWKTNWDAYRARGHSGVRMLSRLVLLARKSNRHVLLVTPCSRHCCRNHEVYGVSNGDVFAVFLYECALPMATHRWLLSVEHNWSTTALAMLSSMAEYKYFIFLAICAHAPVKIPLGWGSKC